MLVQLGNAVPHEFRGGEPVRLDGPAVTSIEMPDDVPLAAGGDVRDIALHLQQNSRVHQLGDYAMLLNVIHPDGAWGSHSPDKPSWVHCESPADPAKADELERLLSEWFDCSRGVPDDVEETHFTRHGPPGTGPVIVPPDPEV